MVQHNILTSEVKKHLMSSNHSEFLRHPKLVAQEITSPHNISPEAIRSQYGVATKTNSHAIGEVLYTDFILPFQISGIILFVAMISCITLTMRHRPGIKRQNITKQNAKNKDNAISIIKPDFNQGVGGIKYD